MLSSAVHAPVPSFPGVCDAGAGCWRAAGSPCWTSVRDQREGGGGGGTMARCDLEIWLQVELWQMAARGIHQSWPCVLQQTSRSAF